MCFWRHGTINMRNLNKKKQYICPITWKNAMLPDRRSNKKYSRYHYFFQCRATIPFPSRRRLILKLPLWQINASVHFLWTFPFVRLAMRHFNFGSSFPCFSMPCCAMAEEGCFLSEVGAAFSDKILICFRQSAWCCLTRCPKGLPVSPQYEFPHTKHSAS